MEILEEVEKNRIITMIALGDIVPVFCACGNVYTPAPGSHASDCLECGRHNVHRDMPVSECDYHQMTELIIF